MTPVFDNKVGTEQTVEKNVTDLKQGGIHIYIAQPATINLTDEKILDEKEHGRADSYYFHPDRVLYIAAHIFLRQKLSCYSSVLPQQWRFETNAYGKPAIENPGHQWLQFNLSHTRGLVACAISYRSAVGIDVEQRKVLSDLESLCRYAFSSSETADILSAQSREEKENRFYTYWTLKEAYIKTLGMGMSIPLQQFAFRKKQNGEWVVDFEPELADEGGNWQFASFVSGEHQLSVSIEKQHCKTALKTASQK